MMGRASLIQSTTAAAALLASVALVLRILGGW